jgi:hypothetical protein
MQLQNETPYPAKLVRMTVDDDRLAASVALRVTYEWANGRFVPAEEQDWVLSAAPWDTPYGVMPGDELFYRDGVDVFILGAARPPRGETASVLDVQVRLGEWSHSIRVFGNRIWQRGVAGLVPSPPAPISSVALSLENAFGGQMTWDGLTIPYGQNPRGKGFYADAASAIGQPLPNIEDPAALITKWDDQPGPVGIGICPPDFAGRMLAMTDMEAQQFNFSARFYNAAFPAMIAPRAAPGDILSVRGISAAPEFHIALPEQTFQVTLTFDDEVIERVLQIDQVGLEFQRGRMFISYRYPFRYVVIPRQQRGCVLRQTKERS